MRKQLTALHNLRQLTCVAQLFHLLDIISAIASLTDLELLIIGTLYPTQL